MLAPLLLVHLTLAQIGTVQGELVVVPDPSGSGHTTNNLIAGLGSTLCAYAAKGLYSTRPDVFDVVVTFTQPQHRPCFKMARARPRARVWGRCCAVLSSNGRPAALGDHRQWRHAVLANDRRA